MMVMVMMMLAMTNDARDGDGDIGENIDYEYFDDYYY